MNQPVPQPQQPARVQRRRIRGWRTPLDAQGRPARYVGRGTRWGNPYRLGTTQIRRPALSGAAWERESRLGKASGECHAFVHGDKTVTWHQVEDASPEQILHLYRCWLDEHPEVVAAARRELAGRDLMCWCPLPAPGQPDHCHAAVLLHVAAGHPALLPTGLAPQPS